MGSIILYVSAFDATLAEWSATGSTPYLNNNTLNYIDINLDDKDEYWFTFEQNSLLGARAITNVKLYIEIAQDPTGDDQINVEMQHSAWGPDSIGILTPDNTNFTWQSIDITAHFDTWVKVNSAKLMLISKQVGGVMHTVFCRRAYLLVTYDDAEWLSGWTYRKPHLITGVAGASVNYQVAIKVYKTTGTDGNETVNAISCGKVYVGANCRDDFGDIRFTDGDGDTLLDYWMETGSLVSGVSALFWVEVADNLATNQIIYIYYKSDNATTTSDGDNTFKFFDDFIGDTLDTTNKWDATGSPSVSSSLLNLDAGEYVFSKGTYGPNNVSLHFKDNYHAQDSSAIHIIGFNTDDHNVVYYYVGEVKYKRTIKADASNLAGVTWGPNTTIVGEVEWGTNPCYFGINATVTDLHNTTCIPTAGALKIKIYCRATYGPTSDTDWVCVRQYAKGEPTHGNSTSWGDEEEGGAAPVNLEKSLNDILGALDFLSLHNKVLHFLRTFADKIGALESFSIKIGLAFHKLITEALGVLDNMVYHWNRTRTFSDIINLTDIKNGMINKLRIFLGKIGLIDTLSYKHRSIYKTLQHIVGLLESRASFGVSRFKQLSDIVGTVGTKVRTIVRNRIYAELLAAKDVFSKSHVLHYLREFTDNLVGLVDSYIHIGGAQVQKILGEVLGMVDSKNVVWHFVMTFLNKLGLKDTQSSNKVLGSFRWVWKEHPRLRVRKEEE